MRQIERATEIYRWALQLDEHSVAALRGLSRLYRIMQRWPELLEVLEKLLDQAATERERVEVLTSIAVIQKEQQLDPKHQTLNKRQLQPLGYHENP